jgi:hypothetical protein
LLNRIITEGSREWLGPVGLFLWKDRRSTYLWEQLCAKYWELGCTASEFHLSRSTNICCSKARPCLLCFSNLFQRSLSTTFTFVFLSSTFIYGCLANMYKATPATLLLVSIPAITNVVKFYLIKWLSIVKPSIVGLF